MFVPAKFQASSDQAADFIRRFPFGTLCYQGAHGPSADHIPFAIVDKKLVGHVAWANPLWREQAGKLVTAIFHGPHAFVDHRWYGRPQEHVPTWNYAVMHVTSKLQVIHEARELYAILDALSPSDMKPWEDVAPYDLRATGVLEKSIVGLCLELDQIQVKFKLSQNRSSEDRERVIAQLKNSPRHSDKELGEFMENCKHH